jgi:hypothetical protein
MNSFQKIFGITWRSILVAFGYIAGLLLAGIIGSMFGWQPSANPDNGKSFILLFISTILLGVFLGPLASRLRLARKQHFILWGSLILFNLGSVALEGAYFAPDLVTVPIPVLLAQQTLATLGAAWMITLLFSQPGFSFSWKEVLRTRPWYSWLWRFIVSSFSYFAFYFIFGGLNYSLVTKPYYESHAGGLTVPAPGVVFTLEPIRGALIVFSVLLFLLSIRGTRRQLIINTGWLLFAIGGIIPLIWQINALPLFLLFASAIEIFFQNFLTGAVAAWLLGIEDPSKGKAASVFS